MALQWTSSGHDCILQWTARAQQYAQLHNIGWIGKLLFLWCMSKTRSVVYWTHTGKSIAVVSAILLSDQNTIEFDWMRSWRWCLAMHIWRCLSYFWKVDEPICIVWLHSFHLHFTLFSWYPQPNQNKPVLINRRFRRDSDPIVSTQ